MGNYRKQLYELLHKVSLGREESTTLQKTLVKRFKTLARQKIATMAP